MDDDVTGKPWRRDWTDEARKAASDAAKARWDATPADVRAERRATSRAAFEAKYPERVPAYAEFRRRLKAGELAPEACDVCGGKAYAQLRYEGQPVVAVVTGWRCYACRRLAR